MKALVYSLALVVLGAFGVNLASSRARVYEIHRGGVVRQVAFVDIDKLIELHPGSKALDIMKATLADVRGTCRLPRMSDAPTVSIAVPAAVGKGQPSNSRQALESQVAWLAVQREADLENDQQGALQARLRASRDDMMKSAESEIRVQVHDIQEAGAAKLRDTAEKYGPSRLNAQMKVDTLKLASKSPGIDSKATEAKLGEAQAVLDTINRSCNDEVDAIKAEEQKQIDALHKAAAAKVDQALEAYTAEQNDRIRRGAKTARDETIAEIYPIVPSAQVGAKVSETTGRPVGKSANLRVSESKSLGTDDLQRRIVLLNTRIRADLSRAVAKFAREKGVAVTFTRSSDRVPDQTQVYYELLREHPLSEAGLVLSDTRGI